MSILNLTHDDIHKKVYGISALNDAKRKAVYDAVMHLNAEGEWYPDPFHRAMKALQANGTLTEFDRKAVEKEFFPDHAW